MYPLKLAAHTAAVSLFSARKYHLRQQRPRKSRSNLSLNVIKFIDSLIENQFCVISTIQIQKTIRTRFNILVSRITINCTRRRLGWIKSGVKYCELIYKANIPVRFSWALQCLLTDERFLFDIEFEETSDVLDQRTRTICYRRNGYSTTLQPVSKHSLKPPTWSHQSKFCKLIKLFRILSNIPGKSRQKYTIALSQFPTTLLISYSIDQLKPEFA